MLRTEEIYVMRAQDFLDHIQRAKSKNTFKEYRFGLRKVQEWYGKSLDEILTERKADVESKNPLRRRNFENRLEEFHRWLITDQPDRKAYSINSARTITLGLIQMFRFFDLDLKMKLVSSEVKRTTETSRNYDLTIEDLRKMFNVADSLRDKVLLLTGKDLALRIRDILSIRKDEIPNLD